MKMRGGVEKIIRIELVGGDFVLCFFFGGRTNIGLTCVRYLKILHVL
jgi:hypothetical protein